MAKRRSRSARRTQKADKANKTQDAPHVLIRRGQKQFQRGKYLYAILSWEEAYTHPDAAEADSNKLAAALAEAHFRQAYQGPTKTRRKELEQATKLKEDDALYAYHLGLDYHRTGDIKQAIAWYQIALELDPAFGRANYALVLALMADDQNATNTPYWQQLSEDERNRLQGQAADDPLSQAMHNLQQAKWDVAQIALTEIVTNTKASSRAKALAHYYLGVIAQRNEQSDRAIKHWQKAYDAGLRSSHLLDNLLLAYTLAAEAALAENTPDQAQQLARAGLAIDPDHARLQAINAHASLETGYQAAQQGDWERALNNWNTVEKASGPNARALAANTAIANEKLELWSQAAEAWREFARRRPTKAGSDGYLAPDQVARLWARISILYMRDEEADEAVNTLKTALNHQPDDTTLGLALARVLAEAERFDAAYNQLDRVLKKEPDKVEALVFRAELAEIAPQGWFFRYTVHGIPEWEDVLKTGDETYAPLARQRLRELYIDSVQSSMDFGFADKVLAVAERGLEYMPDFHLLRAMLVRTMLTFGIKGKTKLQTHLDQIDLTDQEALHQLIDAYHILDEDKEAAKLLQKVNALETLPSEFYLGIANCALGRQEDDNFQRYSQEAIDRANDDNHRNDMRAHIGIMLVSKGDEDAAEEIWQDILKQDHTHPMANVLIAQLHFLRGDHGAANKYLHIAKRWAKEKKDHTALEIIQRLEDMIHNPFASLMGGLGGDLPSLQDMIDSGLLDEDWYDEDDDYY